MEYIEGPDLEELLQPPAEKIFTLKEVLKVADHLSCALAHCHKAGVKHGDIKSNNVKYNIHSGNYVLLDFGLAIMSDEQRRTSLRHAGAIEFMAPEQNDGQMLFETDIYSFGVVLFELLAGQVPFPLNDKSETGRNTVMIAHLEKQPPDLLSLRRLALPVAWSAATREQELQVPAWLINLVYKCLAKKPADRFANGMVLHDYIWQKSTASSDVAASTSDRVLTLERQNRQLRMEVEQLRFQLNQQKPSPPGSAGTVAPTTASSHSLPSANGNTSPTFFKRFITTKTLLVALALVTALFIVVYAYIQGSSEVATDTVIATYKVAAPKAYFYNEPNEETRRNAYAVPGKGSISSYAEKNGFVYTSITNEKGITSKGWLRLRDLVSEKSASTRVATTPTVSAEVKAQLKQAKQFLAEKKPVEALTIYSAYARQEVPEAMYEYARLALQNRNGNLTCTEALEMLKQAAANDYVPAKTTLGFLYTFATDKDALQQQNFYDRCSLKTNLAAGSRLLTEAMLEGDSTAARLLATINNSQ